MVFGIIGWLVAGAIVGFIASKVVNLRGDDPTIGIIASMLGASVAGILFAIISGRGVPAWDPWSIAVAGVGGIVGVVLYHVIRSRSIDRSSKSVRQSY